MFNLSWNWIRVSFSFFNWKKTAKKEKILGKVMGMCERGTGRLIVEAHFADKKVLCISVHRW